MSFRNRLRMPLAKAYHLSDCRGRMIGSRFRAVNYPAPGAHNAPRATYNPFLLHSPLESIPSWVCRRVGRLMTGTRHG